MDGCGRTASGTAVESNAGAVAGDCMQRFYASHAGAIAGLWRDDHIRVGDRACEHRVENGFQLVAESQLA